MIGTSEHAPAGTPAKAQLSDEAFRWLTQKAYDLWGLHITEKKRTLVENRMMSLGRRRRIGSPEDVVESYKTGKGPLTDLEIFDVLSTNLTSFFRDPPHYDIFTEHVLKPWKASGKGKLKVWSAGCSKGCEPYSLSIRTHQELQNGKLSDIDILATDFASSVLREARRGIYELSMVEDLPKDLLQKHFLQGRGDTLGYAKVKPHIKSLVRFQLLNLVETWQLRERFHAIFCRNVMIYFDPQTQERLIQRFADQLEPDGVFFLGSSENISRGTAST
jgi:chemotaxis protein methyltransferase CheR